MIHQNTCQNFFSKYQNRLNNIPKIKLDQINTPKQRRATSSSKNIIKKDFICEQHNLNLEQYCLDCKEDVCSKCYKNDHSKHEVIKYDEITLNEEEINLMKEKLEEYNNKYEELMQEIKEWKNLLEKNIKKFEEYMKYDIINAIKRMINEYKIDNLNYNTIIEYRLAFSLLIENSSEKIKNQKIMKLMKKYKSLKDYEEYKYINENENLSEISLDNIRKNYDLINKGNFEKKGNNIIKFLFSNYSLYSNKDGAGEENLLKKLVEIKQKNHNNFSKIKKFNKSSTNIFRNTSNNFKNILFKKNSVIYEKKKPFDKKRNVETHLEKEELPKFNQNIQIQQASDDDIEDNININSIINEENNKIKKEKKFIKIIKNKNIFNELDKDDNSDDLNLDIDLNYNLGNNILKGRSIIFNNNINNFNNINNISNKNNFINNYNIEQAYSDRSQKSKLYTHQKFNSTLTAFRSSKEVNILNKSQSDMDTDKKKEGDYNTIDFNNYNFELYSNVIGNSCNTNALTNRIFPENEKINIKLVKEIEIDPDKDLNIGFELGNSICRIGIINKSENNIEIFQPYDEENSSIPTIISFKDSNNNILIGKEADDERIENPNYTIFNFVKSIEKNCDEIEGIKELWGYKIYNNKSNKPYIKGYQKNFRRKIFNMEDILTLFLKNIFDEFFSKFKVKKDKCELLKINLVVAVPNNFNYLQRKILEKIFLSQLFNRNSKFDEKENIYYLGKNNIQNIQIKNIKIENSSNLGFLYSFHNQIKRNKNVILIYIEGSSINISLISTSYKNKITSTKKLKNDTNNNIYEIKGIEWTSFGEEDFIDNFENMYLNKDIKEKCYKNPTSLAKLRKIFTKAKNEFYKNPEQEISIDNLFNNNEFKMVLNQYDYEKSCENQFNIIIDLFNELLTFILI